MKTYLWELLCQSGGDCIKMVNRFLFWQENTSRSVKKKNTNELRLHKKITNKGSIKTKNGL